MNDSDAMLLALEQARKAIEHGDVPVGAVVVVNGEVIATGCNRRELDQDPTAHAELIAIQGAANKLGSWRLTDATLVVTLEPCVMCAGAALAAWVGRIVYGAADPKAGAAGSLYNVPVDSRLNHEAEVCSGLMAEECGQLLSSFFTSKR